MTMINGGCLPCKLVHKFHCQRLQWVQICLLDPAEKKHKNKKTYTIIKRLIWAECITNTSPKTCRPHLPLMHLDRCRPKNNWRLVLNCAPCSTWGGAQGARSTDNEKNGAPNTPERLSRKAVNFGCPWGFLLPRHAITRRYEDRGASQCCVSIIAKRLGIFFVRFPRNRSRRDGVGRHDNERTDRQTNEADGRNARNNENNNNRRKIHTFPRII